MVMPLAEPEGSAPGKHGRSAVIIDFPCAFVNFHGSGAFSGKNSADLPALQ